jgi:ribosomal protein L36
MRVKASVKRICEFCYVARRRGKLFVLCKKNPKVGSSRRRSSTAVPQYNEKQRIRQTVWHRSTHAISVFLCAAQAAAAVPLTSKRSACSCCTKLCSLYRTVSAATGFQQPNAVSPCCSCCCCCNSCPCCCADHVQQLHIVYFSVMQQSRQLHKIYLAVQGTAGKPAHGFNRRAVLAGAAAVRAVAARRASHVCCCWHTASFMPCIISFTSPSRHLLLCRLFNESASVLSRGVSTAICGASPIRFCSSWLHCRSGSSNCYW